MEIESIITAAKLITVGEIAEKLSINLTKQQLKYRLARLRKSGRIVTVGKARWLKYKVSDKGPRRSDPIPFYDLLEKFEPNRTHYFAAQDNLG